MAWEYPSNFSNGTNAVTGFGSYFQYMSYATNEWFSSAVLLVIFMISFVATSLVSFSKALAVSSFITLIFASYFLRLGMVSITWVFFLVSALILGILLSRSETKSSY